MAFFLPIAAIIMSQIDTDPAQPVITDRPCSEPLKRIFGKDKREGGVECFDTKEEAAKGCPTGWKHVKDEFAECPVSSLAAAFGDYDWKPVCEKDFFLKGALDSDLLDCCVNFSDNVECPPQYCTAAKNNKETCYAAFKRHCLGEDISSADERKTKGLKNDMTNMFFDPNCKLFVLSEDTKKGPNRNEIADRMRKACRAAGRFAAVDPLCACLNTNVADFCDEENCFARINEQLADMATCVSSQCIPATADSASYIPPQPEGSCASKICAPRQVICANIQSEEAVNLISVCLMDGKISPKDKETLLVEIGATPEEIACALEATQKDAYELNKCFGSRPGAAKRLEALADPKGVGSGGEKSEKEKEAKEKAKEELKKKKQIISGVDNWLFFLVLAAVLLMVFSLVAGIIYYMQKGRQRRREYVNQQVF